MSKTKLLRVALAGTALSLMAGIAQADGTACLITKTDTNPFFVKMKEGAEAKAKELGLELKAYAGKIDGDHEGQVAAVEACVADGAKGILITASDTKAIHAKLDEAYKSLRPDVNPGGIKGVDERGGTLSEERGAGVRDGKIEIVKTGR